MVEVCRLINHSFPLPALWFLITFKRKWSIMGYFALQNFWTRGPHNPQYNMYLRLLLLDLLLYGCKCQTSHSWSVNEPNLLQGWHYKRTIVNFGFYNGPEEDGLRSEILVSENSVWITLGLPSVQRESSPLHEVKWLQIAGRPRTWPTIIWTATLPYSCMIAAWYLHDTCMKAAYDIFGTSTTHVNQTTQSRILELFFKNVYILLLPKPLRITQETILKCNLLLTSLLFHVERFIYFNNSAVCDLHVFLWGASVHLNFFYLFHNILQ